MLDTALVYAISLKRKQRLVELLLLRPQKGKTAQKLFKAVSMLIKSNRRVCGGLTLNYNKVEFETSFGRQTSCRLLPEFEIGFFPDVPMWENLR